MPVFAQLRPVAFAVLVALVMAAGAAPAHSDDVLMQCRHLPVMDGDNQPIFGIEDMAFDAVRSRLILSAYDRHKVDAAISAGEVPPQGGLYLLDLTQLRGPLPDALAASRAVIDADEDVTLFPHGIGLLDQRLAVVNRRPGDAATSAADLLLLEAEGSGFRLVARAQGEAYCRANDLVLASDDSAFFTFDQQACGGLALWLERAVMPRRSGIASVVFQDNGGAVSRAVLGGIALANGILLEADRSSLVVAASRDGEVRWYPFSELDQPTTAPLAVVSVDGAPDNLSLGRGSDVIAAVHPSVFSLFLHMQGLATIPPSRIVLIDAQGVVTVLAEGSGNHLPGAATSALMVEDKLIVSSAWDYGLGICAPGESAGGR